ncbi:unnamed protein product, partial [Staurois parvus]
MAKLGPKCQYFFHFICQHCLNLLWHGVHQSFTGCHWSPLPLSSLTTSHSWWMLETLRSPTFHLRMPHRFTKKL